MCALAIIASLFVSCGKTTDGGTQTPTGKLENPNITLVSHFDPGFTDDTLPISRAKELFEKTYGGKLTVSIYSSDVYRSKLMGLIASDASPEIVQVTTSWMPSFAIKKIIQPVDDLIDYNSLPYQGMVKSASWNGKHYTGYTNGVWGKVIWYNKTMFENFGVKTPKEYYNEGNWTWETFLDCAKQTTTASTWGFSSMYPDIFVSTVAKGFVNVSDDGNVAISWKDDKIVKAIQFTYDLVNTHKVWNGDYGYPKVNFKKGKIAMSVDAIGFIEEYCEGLSDEVDCVPLPVMQKGDAQSADGHGLFYGIGYNTKNVEGAVAFLKILKDEGQKDIDAGVRTPLERNLTDEQLKITREVSDLAFTMSDKNFPSWADDYYYQFWNAVTLSAIPVSTAMDTYENMLSNAINDTLKDS